MAFHYSIPWQRTRSLNSLCVAGLRCSLLGLSGGLGKATLTTNCRTALLRTGIQYHWQSVVQNATLYLWSILMFVFCMHVHRNEKTYSKGCCIFCKTEQRRWQRTSHWREIANKGETVQTAKKEGWSEGRLRWPHHQWKEEKTWLMCSSDCTCMCACKGL